MNKSTRELWVSYNFIYTSLEKKKYYDSNYCFYESQTFNLLYHFQWKLDFVCTDNLDVPNDAVGLAIDGVWCNRTHHYLGVIKTVET